MKARSPSSRVQKSCPAGVLTAARLAGPCLQPLLGTSTGSTIQKQPRLQTHLNSHLLRPSVPSVDPATLTRTGRSCPVFPGCRHPYSSVPFLLPCGIKKVYWVIVKDIAKGEWPVWTCHQELQWFGLMLLSTALLPSIRFKQLHTHQACSHHTLPSTAQLPMRQFRLCARSRFHSCVCILQAI